MAYRFLSRLLLNRSALFVESILSPAPLAGRIIVRNLIGRHKMHLVAALGKEDLKQVPLLEL